MLRFNFKLALRNLQKDKVFSVVNMLGLALGMACCLVIAAYIWHEWQYDHFHKNASNIFRVTEKQNQAGSLYNVAVTPAPLAPALQKEFPEIQNTVRFGNWGGLLKNGDHTYEQKNIQLTDNSLFKIFDFTLLKGNPATALLAPDEIVITENTADKYFGANWRTNQSILSETFRFNNQTDFKLAGIVKNVPDNSSIQFDVLLPLSYLFNSDQFSNKWNSNNYHTYLQLKPGVNLAAFKNKISKQLTVYIPGTKDEILLQPLKDQYLRSAFDFNTDWGKRSDIKYIKIFSGVGLLLLMIACVNFINLSTVRSLKRALEVGIRKVNGASRRQLVLQFLSESVLMASVSGILAVLMVNMARPFLQRITGAEVNLNMIQPVFIPFFLFFVLVIGFFAGLYPAFVVSAFTPAKALKKNGHVLSGKLFRQGLVTTQFAICVTLIICTTFMYQQFGFIRQKDLGFDSEQLVNLRLGGQLGGKANLFQRDLDAVPGVIATAPATMSLVNVDNSSYIEWEGMQKDDKFLITQANVDPGFIPALNMKIIAGSNFSLKLTNDTANYIINETAVQRMGYTNSNAIGKRVTFWGAKGSIIGVVKDFNYKPLKTGIEPFIFRYQPQDRYFSIFIKTLPGKSQQVIAQAEKLYKKYEAETPFEYRFVSEAIDNLYKDDKRTAAIVLLFAGLTIFVGCLGLFGLTVFSAEQRIKEIGIRKVLGATIVSITSLLSKDFLKPVIVSILIATPLAWYITGKWLQNYAYRIVLAWWVFALIGLGIICIALVTISFRAITAAVANPAKSLRTE